MGRRWRNRPPPVRNRRDDALANLDPYEFERVVADYYRRQGYRVDHCGGRGRFDGGIDLKMHRDDEYVIVQCKRENAHQVTHNVGHELLGVLLTEKADRAILVNTGEFTPYAIETAAREPRLELIDGDQLREMLPEYAEAVPETEDDLDRYSFSVPVEDRPPPREPMAMTRPKAPASKANWSRPSVPDRGAGRRSARARRDRAEGARVMMAFAVLAGMLAWQCSREPTQFISLMRGASTVAPTQAAPSTRKEEVVRRAEFPPQSSPPVSERRSGSGNAPRSPEESRRRSDEAMRVLAPTTPEFEPLPGSGPRP